MCGGLRRSVDPPPGFPPVTFGRRPATVTAWVCEADGFPALKYYSAHDDSRDFPVPITCHELVKPVGVSWREWIAWVKVLLKLEG